MSSGTTKKPSPFDDAPSALVYGFFFAAGAFVFALAQGMFSSDDDDDDEEGDA